jgi:hypothetical protein
MRLYQFHLFDARGEIPTLDLGYHEDDEPACSAAIDLLEQHVSAIGVAVYDVDRLVLRTHRSARLSGPPGTSMSDIR